MADQATLAFVSNGTVRTEFMLSVLALAQQPPGSTPLAAYFSLQHGPMLSQARNHVAREFMKSGHQWLWMVDTDIAFDTDTLGRLAEAAHPVKAPIVGALCHAITMDGVVAPTLYSVETGKLPEMVTPEDDTLQRVDATGCACLLVHRRVFERLGNFPFRQVITPTCEYSEDLSFCIHARAQDIPVHVHTGIKVSHIKPVRLG